MIGPSVDPCATLNEVSATESEISSRPNTVGKLITLMNYSLYTDTVEHNKNYLFTPSERPRNEPEKLSVLKC